MNFKKLIKGFAFGVMFTLSVSAFAGGEKAESSKTSGNISILPYLNTSYSVVSLSNTGTNNSLLVIKDSDGGIYYKEWINTSVCAQKVLDFSYLEDGEYSITLSSKGSLSVTERFDVLNKQIAAVNKKEEVSEGLTSLVNHVDNMLYVSHIAFGYNTFGVSIVDTNSDELYNETFDGNSAFSKKYDISELPTGDYQVNINSDQKNYSYEFSK